MKLAETIQLQQAADYYETYIGLSPIPSTHPPSLKNPIQVKIAQQTDGWHSGDSKEARQKAMDDLAEVHKRLLRQIGRSVPARVADYPVHPMNTQWP